MSRDEPQRTVLVVDDVEEVRALVRFVLGKFPGVRISGEAKNTWEARLEVSRNRPDLVLLDEVLPGESSLDLFLELTAQKIPVILMTSLQSPSHPLPAEAIGRWRKPLWKDWQAAMDQLRLLLQKLS